jgi:hypothetical protein
VHIIKLSNAERFSAWLACNPLFRFPLSPQK